MDITTVDKVTESVIRHYIRDIQERGKYTFYAVESQKETNHPDRRRDFRKPVATTSINNYIRNLRVFFNWLDREYIIKRNPMKKIRQLKVNRKAKEFLSDDELRRLLTKMDRSYYSEHRDYVIVGYDGFIKNYNLDGLHADKIEEKVDPATYYEAGKELRAQGNYAEAIASFELAGDYLDSTAQIAELEDLDMLLQGISSNQALSYFNDRLADYPAITGDEIRELVLNESWRGFRTGRVWTFLENGTIDGASSDPNFTRTWRIDGNLLTYSGLAIDGVRFYSYAVHKVNEDGYLLVQDGQVSATMIRTGK